MASKRKSTTEEAPAEADIKIAARNPDVPPEAFEAFLNGMKKMPMALAAMGFERLRPGQDKAVKSIMMGVDSVIILPTGMGKSACFVIPTLCMGWRTIVIYPLISLMRDQAQAMMKKGISAASISSDETDQHNASVIRDWATGNLQMMLVSPERFANKEWAQVVSMYPPDYVALDECFPGDTYVPTEFGHRSMLDLWHTHKAGGALPRVKSREADGHISWRQITNVFENRPSKLVRVKIKGGGEVRCTPDHVWFAEAGEVCARHLHAGGRVYADSGSVSHKIRGLNSDQMQMIIGSFLGDGGFQHVSKTIGTFRLATTHGIAQKDYAKWKMDVLQGTVEPVERNGFSGKKAVRCRTCVFQLPKEGAPTTGNKWGKKTAVPGWMVKELDARGLAIWAMDDGCGKFNRIGELNGFEMSTNSFTREAVDQLVEMLSEKFGISAKPFESKGWCIRVCKEGAMRLRELVVDYLHPSLLYKFGLTPESWGRCLKVWDAEFAPHLLEVLSVSAPERSDEPLYDLEVEETHNYFVSTTTTTRAHRGYVTDTAVLVHNCHTFSAWADTFRPGYKTSGAFIQMVNPKVVAALSATLDEEAEQEVREGLGIRDAKLVYHYPRRTNLHLATMETRTTADAFPWMATECKGATIGYSSTRKRVELYQDMLKRYTRRDVHMYHGGMKPAEKKYNQDKFMKGEADFIVATNAFGMGIDKPDIRNVVHLDMPGSLLALAQEVGRAGRDGMDSWCTIIPTPEGVKTQRFFIRCGNPDERNIRDFVKAAAAMRSQRGGVITAKRDDIAEKAGLDKMTVRAIMSFCLGENLFVHDAAAAKKMRVKFAQGVTSFTKVEAKMRDAICDIGVETDGDGWLHLDVDALSTQLDIEPASVGSRLRVMNEAGKLEWVKSSTSRPLRLGVDINDIPEATWERLNGKAEEADDKLSQVLEYCETPDDEKHDFLESHLNR